MEVKKHKKVVAIILGVYAIVFLMSSVVALNPNLGERLISALVEPGIQISPSGNGLANINAQSEASEDSYLGEAIGAGDRFQSQMNFLSVIE